jgi:hypothetical protein
MSILPGSAKRSTGLTQAGAMRSAIHFALKVQILTFFRQSPIFKENGDGHALSPRT